MTEEQQDAWPRQAVHAVGGLIFAATCFLMAARLLLGPATADDPGGGMDAEAVEARDESEARREAALEAERMDWLLENWTPIN